MRYAGVIYNDITAAPGLCVSFFTQGCPHRCKGCHNPETWDFKGGLEFTPEVLSEVIEGLTAQGIQRNFCIMGGEPLCPENLFLTQLMVMNVKEKCPDAKIYIWTGYYYDDLTRNNDKRLQIILDMADYLIDGPFDETKRDLTLVMRGSSNQNIIPLKN